ncbi:hypothetical protein ACQCLI_18265 [Pseudomonas nitroreducens]|uniref:hypothetical protein n=1 Tax=Pseudomonas nitroreducens TaxID=46680 RepID=UPI0002D68DD4|nr:hypothetical protein [Pseudomonas nitroreducens]
MSFTIGILAALIVYALYQVQELQKQLRSAHGKLDTLYAAIKTNEDSIADVAVLADEIARSLRRE